MIRARPYQPQTNGKAEAMVKVLLHGWAYRELYPTGEARIQALQRFLRFYNHTVHTEGLTAPARSTRGP